jgi:hypothetical protein
MRRSLLVLHGFPAETGESEGRVEGMYGTPGVYNAEWIRRLGSCADDKRNGVSCVDS